MVVYRVEMKMGGSLYRIDSFFNLPALDWKEYIKNWVAGICQS
jgi:hypothetical protein